MALFAELKRRNVFRAGIAYVVLSWLLLQVTDVVVPTLELPEWVARLVLFLLVLGFPLALIFTWVFELTPDGLMREKDVVRAESITRGTGRKLDYITIALLVLALGWFAWGSFFDERSSARPASEPPQAAKPGTEKGEPGIPIIAVLPFKAAGSDDGGFLAGGLHDDLLTRLAKLGGFRVISRTSMMEYADATISMPEIGRELGADYILEGGVQAREERVRINAQLIDAPRDSHIWAEVYDRKLTAADLFDVQAELAIAIAAAIKTKLSPEELAVVEDVPTTHMGAYSAYLRGMQLRQARGRISAEHRDEIEAFEEAVALDPDFALAWARLSAARSRLAFVTHNGETAEAALAALARARALQPTPLEAELAWAEYLYRVMYEYQPALEALERDPALAARSDTAYAYSLLYSLAGDADAVRHWVGEHRQCYRIETKNDLYQESQRHLYYAIDFARAGLIDEAIAELRVMLEEPGGHRFPYFDDLPAFDPGLQFCC